MQTRLTAEQSASIAAISDDLTAQILAECYRRNLHRVAEDILSDARLRTLTHVATHNVTDPEKIKSRARSCALDAIKSAARLNTNIRKHLATVTTAADTIRINDEPLYSTRTPQSCCEADEADLSLCFASFDRAGNMQSFSYGLDSYAA